MESMRKAAESSSGPSVWHEHMRQTCGPPRCLSACPFLPPQMATSMAMTMQHDCGMSLPINTGRCSTGGPPTLHRDSHRTRPGRLAVTQGQLTADSPEGTCCLLKMSSSFRSFVEHAFFSSSLTFQIRSFWACVRQPAAERSALLRERSPTRGRVHLGPDSQPCTEQSCPILGLCSQHGAPSRPGAWALGHQSPWNQPLRDKSQHTHAGRHRVYVQHRREEGRLPNCL